MTHPPGDHPPRRPGPAEAPVAVPGAVPGAARGTPYHLLLSTGRPGIWRPLVGIPLVVLGAFVVAPFVLQVPLLVFFVVTGQDVVDAFERLLDFSDPTPLGLAFLNLSLASAIPIVFLVAWLLHGRRPGWLTSVRPRMRWGFLGACLGLALVALVATLVVSAVLPAGGEAAGVDSSAGLNEWTDRTRDFVLVVVLLTPLQAAGEEYLFRGYLTQAFGRVFAAAGAEISRAAAVVVPALLFALAHGLGQSLPVFIDRFAFGLVAGVLVVVTGGLEAGIAMHVLNNWLAFGFALAFGDLGSALNPTGGSWWMLPATLTQSLVFLVLVYAVARATRLPHEARPAVLEGPRRLG